VASRPYKPDGEDHPPAPAEDGDKELYSVYEDYAKTLRTWLVAYGIGLPAVILARKELFDALQSHAGFATIVLLLLLGTATQILLAFFNKWAAWLRFAWLDDPERAGSKLLRFANWYSNQFWIDMVLELTTLGCFAYATYLCFLSFIP
jgi:hypothetical protein